MYVTKNTPSLELKVKLERVTVATSGGYAKGYDDAQAEFTAMKDALVSEFNDHLDGYGESVESAREIPAAAHDALEKAYDKGVEETNAKRDAEESVEEAVLVSKFNEHLSGYGVPAESTGEIPAAAQGAIDEAYGKGEADGKAVGYTQGVEETNTKRDAEESEKDAALVAQFNARLEGYCVPAVSAREIPAAAHDALEKAYSKGVKDGEAVGYKTASDSYTAEIIAELGEINGVIAHYGGEKSETLNGVSEAIGSIIGKVSQEEMMHGYTQGVEETNAKRDAEEAAEDAVLVSEFNDYLSGYGVPAESTREIPAAAQRAVDEAYGKGEADGKAVGYTQGAEETNAKRDAEDAALLESFNERLGGYGVPAESAGEIPAAAQGAIDEAYGKGEADGAADQYYAEIKDSVFTVQSRIYAKVIDHVLYIRKENDA